MSVVQNFSCVAELVGARQRLRDLLYEDGHLAVRDERDTALAAIDIAIGRAEQRLAQADAEVAGYKHEDDLIQAALQRFVTDCSTPSFQLARNAVDRVDAQDAEIAALRQQIARQAITVHEHQQSWHEMRDAKEQAEARVQALEKELAACYRATGADCDGNNDSFLASRALQAVEECRAEQDTFCGCEENEAKPECERHKALRSKALALEAQVAALTQKIDGARNYMHVHGFGEW